MAKIQVTDNADAKKKTKSAKAAVKKSANSSTPKKSTKRVSVDTTSVTPKKIKRIKVEKAEKKAPKKPVKAKVAKAEPKKTEIKVTKAKKEAKKTLSHTSSKVAISSNNTHSVLQKSTTLSRRYVKRPENEAVVDTADISENNQPDNAARIDVAEAIISPEAVVEVETETKVDADAAKEASLSPEAALDAILEEAAQKAEEAKEEALAEAETAAENVSEKTAENTIVEAEATSENVEAEAATENIKVKTAAESTEEEVAKQETEEKAPSEDADSSIKISIGKSSIDAKTEKARKAQAKKERQAMKLAKAQTKLAEKRARAEAEAARKAQIRAERMAKRQARIAMPAIKAGAKAGSTRDRALKSAMRSVATMNAGDTPKEMHREFRKKRKGGRIVLALLCSAATVAALVAFVNFNMPDISVRVAAMQTGIDASYPSIIPRGYTLSNVSSDKDGQIAMVFKNSDDNSFTLTEEKSTWDSNALLNNYVKKVMTSEYTTMREQGITIYTEGDSAAWVNGGILFKVKASGKYLTKEQIRNLATSV